MKSLIRLISICLIFSAYVANSQNDLPVEDVEVVKDFEARILNSNLYSPTAQLPGIDTTMTQKYNYEVGLHDLNIDYSPPTLRPVAMPRAKQQKFYNAYAQFLFGFPMSTSGQLNFAKVFDSGFEFGVNIEHDYVNNENNRIFHKYTDNKVAVEVAQLFKNDLRLAAQLDYSFDRYFNYGHADSTESDFNENQVLNQYQNFEIQTSLGNAHSNKNNLNYKGSIHYGRFVNSDATRQNDFGFDLMSSKWFNEKHPLKVNVGGEFTSLMDTVKRTLNNFYFHPSFTLHGNSFSLEGGVNIMSNFDIFYFYPDAEFNLRLLDERIIAHIGLDGSLHKNTYRSLTETNPFIEHRLDTISNTSRRSYYAGVSGNISSVEYHIQAKYSTLENLATYQPYDIDRLNNPGYFEVIYLKDVTQLTLSLDASYPLSEYWAASLAFYKHFYGTEGNAEVWGLPTFSLNPGITYYSLDDKFSAWAEMTIQDGTYYRYDGETNKTDSRFDLSLGSEYFFTEKIGATLQVNNLFGNKYQRFYRYPTIGTQIQIGLVARF